MKPGGVAGYSGGSPLYRPLGHQRNLHSLLPAGAACNITQLPCEQLPVCSLSIERKKNPESHTTVCPAIDAVGSWL